tara:strand:- start:968 stop:1603 length:636 start_codon:yes stop_codon:yes gene_type:complete
MYINYNLGHPIMAKNAGDIILRDRMEFDLDSNGDRTTVYGRIDLSSYISVTEKKGLAVKQIFFQVREQSSTTLDNTGVWDWMVADEVADAGGHTAALKVYATSRAFENAANVGIASPDVLCLREYISQTSPGVNGTTDVGTSYAYTDRFYGPMDLHPEGYTLVSDLLIGVAADRWLANADSTLEIDILIIAEEVKVTQDRMNDMLQQAQDL